MRLLPIAVLFLCFDLGAPHAAHAQASDATSAAAARALFSEGVAATDASDWTLAADRFRAALALRPSSVIALNLAVALGHLGRVVEATELLRGVLLDRAANESVRASAQETLTTLEPRVAWLEVRLQGATDGVTVQVDTMTVPQVLLDSAVPVDPGAHRVAAMREGEIAVSADVELSEGERRPVVLDVPPLPPPPPPEPIDEVLEVPVEPPPPVDDGPDPLLIGLGVGGGVLVLGGVLGLVLGLTLSGEPTPFMGNAGVLEVRP